MMRKTYDIKYRQPGQWFWRRLKKVQGDGVDANFRFFHLEDDSIVYCSRDAEVWFPKERQEIIAKRMSQEIGQPVVRA